MSKTILFGTLLFLGLAIVYADTSTPAGSCKVENAECNVNESGKQCCPGLTCIDKDVPAEIGKCGYLPTPTPTNTPTPTAVPCEKQIVINQCTYNLIEPN